MSIRASHFKCALLLTTLLVSISISGEPSEKSKGNNRNDNGLMAFCLVITIGGSISILIGCGVVCYLGITANFSFTQSADLNLKLTNLRAKAEELRINFIGLETEKTAYETHNEEFTKVKKVDHQRIMTIIEAIEKQAKSSTSEQEKSVRDQSRQDLEDRISVVRERAKFEHERYLKLMQTTMTEVEFSQELRKTQARDRARQLKEQQKAEKIGRLARLRKMMQVYKKQKEVDIELGDRNNTDGVSKDQTKNNPARRLTEENEKKSQIERLQLEVHDGRSENEIIEPAKEIGLSAELLKKSEFIREQTKKRKENAIDTSEFSKSKLNVKPKGNCIEDTSN